MNQRSHQIVRILGGLCQAIMLILLTFLFGSMYGQRLFLSLYFVLAFTAAIFLCRASSIWASYRLQKATHLTVIECQNYSEMDQAQKLLLTLDNVLIKNKTSGAIFLNRSRVYGHDRVRCWGWPFVLSYFYCGLAYTVCTFVMSIPFTIAWTYNSYKIALFTNIYWNGFLGYMGGMFARADFLENAGHNSTLKESMGSGAVEGTSNGSSTTTTPPSPAGSGPGEQERVDVG